MEYSCIELNNLPDEILLIILKKLLNVEVLHSFIGLNNRLNTIGHDSIFTSHLTLMRYISNESICPLPDSMLHRFCSQILPSIHHKIKWLNLESSCMERILLATNYPSLNGLGLYKISLKKAVSLFTEESCLTHIDKNQISSLVIHIDYERSDYTRDERILIFTNILTIFTNILTIFTHLQNFNFGIFSTDHKRLALNISPSTGISSNLFKLNVCVGNFLDCLYLLDGRFNQLHTLDVKIFRIDSSSFTISNKEKLPNLRYFSLESHTLTTFYDELIVPLLQRMVNLEKLDLSLFVSMGQKFFDGNDLKQKLINHMSRLNKLTFYVCSSLDLRNQINLPSNEDIKLTLNDLKTTHIISYIDYFEKKQYGRCRIYSYPYRLKFYNDVTNNFPGGLCKSVREITLADEHPFEYEFFLRISQSFPFVVELSLNNSKAQKNKLCKKSNKDNQDLPTIKFPYLTNLSLDLAHDDYIEQFLDDSKTSISNNLHINVGFEPMKRVTYHFTRDTTRINCAKLKSLCLNGYGLPKYARNYFPHTKMS